MNYEKYLESLEHKIPCFRELYTTNAGTLLLYYNLDDWCEVVLERRAPSIAGKLFRPDMLEYIPVGYTEPPEPLRDRVTDKEARDRARRFIGYLYAQDKLVAQGGLEYLCSFPSYPDKSIPQVAADLEKLYGQP